MKTKKPRNIILFLCCILCSSLNSQDTDAKSEKTLSDKGRFFINRMRSPYLPIYGVTDTLAMLPFDEKTAMYSSADLTGDNDDGFFSTYSYLYQDTNGHFVIFDELGPGTLTRMHFAFWWISGTTFLSTPPPNFPLSIYIDDMVTPRHIVQANDIFSGRIFPLVVNVLNGQYGYNLYYPFYFQSRMKITMPFKPNFFQFDFRKGYRKTDPAKWISAINRAGQYPHDLAGSWSGATTTTIPANSRARIASNIGPAVIMGMKFTVAQISDWDSLRIEIKWDNDTQPSVNAPLGMLCGSSNPAYNLASLLFSMNGTTGYCYFPMPFNSSAQIDIVNTTSSSTTLKFDSVVIRGRYPEPFGYFCATHTSSRPTQLGRDHLVLDVPGQGTYIGTVFQAEVNLGIPNVDLYYLEGDERIYIDGAASPSYHGTGTEETFNGAWYSPLGQDGPFVHALCGYSGHVTNFSIPELKRSFYRLYIMDPIVFSNRLRYQLEHGPKNDMNANYETVSFYYIKRSPALVQTDSLDEGDPVSESQHNYTFTDSAPIIELTSKYVGDSTVQPLYDRGRAILGSSGFDANLTPDNHGVLLRCRADHETGRVSAMVSVDGIDVGIWYQATWNPYARWVDREFKIPANFTAGRQRIRIQIRPLGPGEWRSFFFSVYCFNY